jgi:hypothetical protein
MLFSFPPSFFGRGFCSVYQLAAAAHRRNEDVLRRHVCWLTKTMTKKVRATPHSSPPLGLLAVPLGVGLGALVDDNLLF